jgi:acyl carrier protein
VDIHNKLKETIISGLNLEGVTPNDIINNAPLFGNGLGLDSLDAVELVVLLQVHFGVEVSNMDEGKAAFQSIDALVEFIQGKQGNTA